MLLNELFPSKNLVRIVAKTQRLQHEQEHGDHKPREMTLDQLSSELGIDSRDLLDLIGNKKGPLKNVITAVENGKIVWYNEDNDEQTDDKTVEKKKEDNEQRVDSMAKKAAKKAIK
jgi:hypothetical protein